MTIQTALPAGTWHVDTSATTVSVSVKKLGLFTVPATLKVTSGSIEVDDDHQVVSVDVVADSASYASKNAKRNEHVLGSDFLDADKHPTIEFRADAVAGAADGYRSIGTITIKGQTSPIDVTIDDVEVGDDQGSFTANATVDRKSIGVDKLPAFIVGRNLELTVSAIAIRAA